MITESSSALWNGGGGMRRNATLLFLAKVFLLKIFILKTCDLQCNYNGHFKFLTANIYAYYSVEIIQE